MIRCVLVTVNPDINLFTIRRFTIGITLSLSALKQAFKRVTSIVNRLIVNKFSFALNGVCHHHQSLSPVLIKPSLVE